MKKIIYAERREDMIRINKSPNADSRTDTEKVSEEVLLENSRQHISDVAEAIYWMMWQLLAIAKQHDWTKVRYIKEFYHDYKASQDGFQGDFKQQHWFHDLHLKERHHLNDYCPDDVTLFDVLERVADVTMAGLARSGQIYDEDIDSNMLVRAYNNTIRLLSHNTQVMK